MEPGVLRGYRCTGSVFPGSVVMRRPIHDASDKPSNTRSAVPIYGLEWWVQRLRPFGAEQYRRYDMGWGRYARHFARNQQILYRAAVGLCREHQSSASFRDEPDPNAGGL